MTPEADQSEAKIGFLPLLQPFDERLQSVAIALLIFICVNLTRLTLVYWHLAALRCDQRLQR